MSRGVLITVGMIHSVTLSFPSLNNRKKRYVFRKKNTHSSLGPSCHARVCVCVCVCTRARAGEREVTGLLRAAAAFSPGFPSVPELERPLRTSGQPTQQGNGCHLADLRD